VTGPLEPVPVELLRGHSTEVAPRLLNLVLAGRDGTRGRIVEVEAYAGVDDPASHARMGETPRNATMFRRAGLGYVYFTYGMHWCMNVVTGEDGSGQAVLLRALEPLAGIDCMRERRPAARREVDLTNGPAKLCEALGIDGALDGVDLLDADSPVRLLTDGTPAPARPGRSTRIGISAATERPWRWFVEGNPWVSRHPGIRPPRRRAQP
jgi:DNA-3-methyladenine glycosylase